MLEAIQRLKKERHSPKTSGPKAPSTDTGFAGHTTQYHGHDSDGEHDFSDSEEKDYDQARKQPKDALPRGVYLGGKKI